MKLTLIEPSLKAHLHIAFTMQNAGNDLAEDVGPVILIKRTVEGLEKNGHSISIMRLSGRNISWFDDIHNLNNTRIAPVGMSGNKVFMLGESGIRRFQRELQIPYFAIFDSFRFYEACIRGLKKFSLVHEYGGVFSVGTAIASKRMSIPYVLTVEADTFLEKIVKGVPLKGVHKFYAYQIAKLTYRLADKIITVSEQAKSHFVKSWQIDSGKIAVLQNGVDIQQFHPEYNPSLIRKTLKLDAQPVIGFVGSFQHWHGIDGLLESFFLVLQEIPEAKLVLVGDGPTRNLVEQKINDLNIGAAVILMGLVSQNRVPEILSLIDIAVVPYPKLPKELWFSPMKLYEYMAAGKAIVATNEGQMADVLKDGFNGLLVAPGDIEGCARAMIRLIKNPAERQALGIAARKQAIEKHSLESYINQLEKVYFDAIELSSEKVAP